MHDEEPKYTLNEAAKILARQRCMRWGHTELTDFKVDNKIVKIICGDCGAVYLLEEENASVRNQNP